MSPISLWQDAIVLFYIWTDVNVYAHARAHVSFHHSVQPDWMLTMGLQSSK